MDGNGAEALRPPDLGAEVFFLVGRDDALRRLRPSVGAVSRLKLAEDSPAGQHIVSSSYRGFPCS